MVSRSNLSGRPGMSGVLNRVMNPAKPRAPRPEASGGVFSRMQSTIADAKEKQAAQQGGGGLSGMVGRALAAGKERQAEVANRAVKPQAPPQAPGAGPKRGPRRRPTMQENMAARGTRGPALRDMGATQEEVAAPGARGFVERAVAGANRGRGRGVASRVQEQAASRRADLEQTGEAGGTVTETPVIEPSLNEARRMRSRSGRIRR